MLKSFITDTLPGSPDAAVSVVSGGNTTCSLNLSCVVANQALSTVELSIPLSIPIPPLKSFCVSIDALGSAPLCVSPIVNLGAAILTKVLRTGPVILYL